LLPPPLYDERSTLLGLSKEFRKSCLCIESAYDSRSACHGFPLVFELVYKTGLIGVNGADHPRQRLADLLVVVPGTEAKSTR